MALNLSSPEFADGERLPLRCGYEDQNVSPPLTINGVTQATETLALVMDDPDAVEPAGKVWDHWLVWNIPSDIESIPEGWDPSTVDAVEGRNDFGERGYGGPAPPDRPHTYRFRLYALDDALSVPAGSNKDTLHDAISGHVLDDAELTGLYAP